MHTTNDYTRFNCVAVGFNSVCLPSEKYGRPRSLRTLYVHTIKFNTNKHHKLARTSVERMSSHSAHRVLPAKRKARIKRNLLLISLLNTNTITFNTHTTEHRPALCLCSSWLLFFPCGENNNTYFL